ncbi:MAG: transporter substrate-binding domain-containing protein [Pseudonocardiaceae bacterium]
MSTRFALACGVLTAVVLATTACVQPSNKAAAPVLVPTTLAPQVPTSPPGPEPATPECNPRASLRPYGALPEPGRMPAESTMARIAQRGHLIAGVNQDIQQIAFRDESLQLQGFDVDVVRDIVEAIFGDRGRVVFRQLNVADRLKVAKSGEIDLLVATTTITCERREEVEFSTGYLETGQRVLVNRGSGFTDLASLEGRPVCASRGSTGEQKIQDAIPKLIPVSVSATTDCLALLQLGKIDAVCTNDVVLASLAAQDSRTEVVGPNLTDEPFGVAIHKDTPDLVRFVNAVLERRTQDGRWRDSYARWLTLLGPPPSPPTPQYRD